MIDPYDIGGRPILYTLIGHDPVPCRVYLDWAVWYDEDLSHRRVALDFVTSDSGEDVEVSTVFLGMDHAFFGEPILFETMVFGGVLTEWLWRYCTWEEAEQGHAQVVTLVKRTEVLGDDADACRLAAQMIARTTSKPTNR